MRPNFNLYSVFAFFAAAMLAALHQNLVSMILMSAIGVVFLIKVIGASSINLLKLGKAKADVEYDIKERLEKYLEFFKQPENRAYALFSLAMLTMVIFHMFGIYVLGNVLGLVAYVLHLIIGNDEKRKKLDEKLDKLAG